MLCSQIREVAQKVEKQGMLIGRSDLLQIVCGQCDRMDTCPSLAVQFDDVATETSDRRSNL